MEAVLQSMANCFIVPFRPQRWAQPLRMQGPKGREWSGAHQSSLGFGFAVTGKTWMNLIWHFLVFSCLLTCFLLLGLLFSDVSLTQEMCPAVHTHTGVP